MTEPNVKTQKPKYPQTSIPTMTSYQFLLNGGAGAFPNQIVNITDGGGVQYCDGTSLYGSVGAQAKTVTWGGTPTTSITGTSDVFSGTFPQIGFSIVAGTGITALSVAIQGATNSALSSWVTLGIATLSAPGTAILNSAVG